MLLKIVLLLAIIFQVIAAVVSLRLTRKTKYNLSWIFISLGFAALLLRMILEALPFYFDVEPKSYGFLYIWLGVGSAIFFAIGLILIRSIFTYMEKIEKEKRANEKRFLSILIQAEDNERKRLAKDLHDGLGPLLSTIKMSLSALKKPNTKEQEKIILDNLDKVVVESMKSIKEISDNLNPHVLDNFGLDKAINNFIQKITTTGDIKIKYTSNLNDLRIEVSKETVLYRVICELINNTIKHANANKININLYYDIHNISLTYKDNGRGFELDNLFKPQEKGTGIYNIYNRINSLKGFVNIDSKINNGTIVKIKIPFSNDIK
ncbi:MAG: sensor histidine kinase [Bacteroidales bacterium]|jgi:signal transduction histidine kinase|nr:sensor histidine kinase [Bacteroidales bacterium]MCK9498764.1 sensor histidine kinase [Bacteroidales bacterium]MDY0314302.1 sensor histidine kinase [Bacteroidales bacterium]NLB85913.1 sensor histidine kinase [Bacteroidales bacterium]